MKTQAQRLLDHLATVGPVDPMTALNTLGIYRLAARVYDLKRAGHCIVSESRKVINRFGESERVAVYHLHEAVSR